MVKTDYINYALIYGCLQSREDGFCHKHHQLVYLLARTPQPLENNERIQEYVDAIEDVLCVSRDQLIPANMYAESQLCE